MIFMEYYNILITNLKSTNIKDFSIDNITVRLDE